MIEKLITKIDEADLHQLVNEKTREGRFIEYKRLIDEDTQEICADISSFANTNGGDLVYGIADVDGAADELIGIPKPIDQQIQRIENTIKRNIFPRIPQPQFQSIELVNGNVALIVRINKSWIGPHSVQSKSGNSYRMYGRTSSGKFLFDESEIRRAYRMAEGGREQIRSWVNRRIELLVENKGEMPTQLSPRLAIHLVPASAYVTESRIDAKSLMDTFAHFRPNQSGNRDYRINLDGFIVYCQTNHEDPRISGYSQFYTNGCIEIVDARFFGMRAENAIASIWFENQILALATESLNGLKQLGINTPIYLFTSMIDANGIRMAFNNPLNENEHGIDRNPLVLPEIILESYDIDLGTALRPVFDSTWNACGYIRSFNYNESGERTVDKHGKRINSDR